ncbi:MAG TPA: Hsp20/alpha crystallin family protein [Humidesulfovibrio sp.]|uniref:Hsp20/alpha crystallin family protein n=1 Tax=Humidesulfovibrio sp. TaxID=2910988 RepID=UPI002CF1675A|nr:Hsp20/alpha crystallin family protein [Humidesulfovibrio sp.]HWR03121.1 Hsp20/alpha crystallin family protein [Humidesulfovibrio sp.]
MTEAASIKNEAKPLPRVSPATDILEREDGFYVYMDIPGVRREDLKIDINENELLVTGRAMQGAAEKETFLEVQFGPGEYVRAVALSDLVDREGIKASLKDGVLMIRLPRLEKAAPRRIPIQTA